MFEGKPLIASGANGSEHGDSVGGELFVPNWKDLTARLAAARELNRQLAVSDETEFASFDAQSARKIACQHGLAAGSGKHGVNPDDLANGKWPEPNVGQRIATSEPANRGNT
ncbi:MAG: hypothetical protein JY451_06105 [Erythrobacter sp.]|nr:MAG: hypothetical protein JY451_06105 [Erythrobacter sp.]